ncbi:hypothetical protein BGW39_005229 [Mortierella sp. 14UC]|nr:hypothetical protein BGW39_005229 [Mortierella sp. 14UC]
MSAPLHIVFEKRLSKKQPAMPSPSLIPQSILIKDESYFAPTTSSTASSSIKASSTSGLYARRGSESSVSSTGSAGSHDCFQCGLHGSSSDIDSSSEDDHHRHHGTLSRSPSESSTGSSDSLGVGASTGSNGGRRLRVQWVDRI